MGKLCVALMRDLNGRLMISEFKPEEVDVFISETALSTSDIFMIERYSRAPGSESGMGKLFDFCEYQSAKRYENYLFGF